MMMGRFGPRKLADQLMLVTASALLLAQGINLGLLIRSQQHERIGAIAAGAAAQIGEASERLDLGLPLGPRRDEADADDLDDHHGSEGRGDRHDGAREDRRGGGRDGVPDGGPGAMADAQPGPVLRRFANRRFFVGDAPRFRDDMTEWPELAQRVASNFAETESGIRQVQAARTDVLAPRAHAQRRRPYQLVAVAAQLPDGRWVTLRARVPEPPSRFGAVLMAQTGVLLTLLLGPILFVAWRVTRPLAGLARAAAATGSGQESAAVAESGPEDVRALIRAFNAMRERIGTMLTDKDRMMGAIGHDLRTPLASLRVRVEQIGDAALRDKMAATITEMAAMLDDILALARAGQPREVAEPTDMAMLLSDVVADYQAMGRPASLAAQGALASATVRPLALRRALRNLIDNAISYGNQATVGLALEPAGCLSICVDDSGPGIPDGRIAAMIEPFARAEESRNRNTGGTGIGLALARSIVQAEGGELKLANRPGGGLSARIILPCR
jgi:signal transduction histidine kinase